MAPETVASPEDEAKSQRFRDDLVIRGEAVEPTKDGKLPLDATHAIINKEDGTTVIKRARAKYF